MRSDYVLTCLLVFWMLVLFIHINAVGEHTFWVEENTVASTKIGQIATTSQQDPLHLSFTSLAQLPASDFFKLDRNNGTIWTSKTIDREALCPAVNKQAVALKNVRRRFKRDILKENNTKGDRRTQRKSHRRRRDATPSESSCQVNFLVHMSNSDPNAQMITSLIPVTIHVLDQNDNNPLFVSQKLTVKVSESSKIGSEFPLAKATDADHGINSLSDYRLISISLPLEALETQACDYHGASQLTYQHPNQDPANELFTLVITETGDGSKMPKLRQINPLDYETVKRIHYCLIAVDGGGRTGSLPIIVEVLDANDNVPQWIGLPYKVELSECVNGRSQSTYDMKGQIFSGNHRARFIIRLHAQDKDSGPNGRVTYKLANSDARHAARITGRRGGAVSPASNALIEDDRLYIVGKVNYESTKFFRIPVEAIDGGGLTNFTEVEVSVTDCNDNKPQIRVFPIQSRTPSNFSKEQLSLEALKHVELRISEEDDREQSLATVSVTDADSGPNAQVSCSLNWNNRHAVNPFKLQKITGNNPSPNKKVNTPEVFVLLKKAGVTVDREKTPIMKVTIVCSDMGYPRENVAQRVLTVGVLDTNDNAPIFLSRTPGHHPCLLAFIVNEGEPAGTAIGSIKARDADFGINQRLRYALVPPNEENTSECGSPSANTSTPVPFGLNPDTGLLYTLSVLNREEASRLCCRVSASDAGRPSHTTECGVVVTVRDINDNAPTFSNNAMEDGYIILNVKETIGDQPLSRMVGQINATDVDLGENGTVRFALAPTDSRLQSLPIRYRITPNGQLFVDGRFDRELLEEHIVTVIAHDSGSIGRRLSSTAKVRIRLLDLNDNGPTFLQPPANDRSKLNSETVNISLITRINTSVYQVCATDSDKGINAMLNFTLRSANNYLSEYFQLLPPVQHAEGTDGYPNRACADLVLRQPLTKLLRADADPSYRGYHLQTPLEYLLYVTATDQGLRSHTKTARIRLLIYGEQHGRKANHNRVDMLPPLAPDREGTRYNAALDDPFDTIYNEYGNTTLGGLHADDWDGTAIPSSQMGSQDLPNGHYKSTRAVLLFVTAIIIVLLFVGVLALFVFIFLRDTNNRRGNGQRTRSRRSLFSIRQAKQKGHVDGPVPTLDLAAGRRLTPQAVPATMNQLGRVSQGILLPTMLLQNETETFRCTMPLRTGQTSSTSFSPAMDDRISLETKQDNNISNRNKVVGEPENISGDYFLPATPSKCVLYVDDMHHNTSAELRHQFSPQISQAKHFNTSMSQSPTSTPYTALISNTLPFTILDRPSMNSSLTSQAIFVTSGPTQPTYAPKTLTLSRSHSPNVDVYTRLTKPNTASRPVATNESYGRFRNMFSTSTAPTKSTRTARPDVYNGDVQDVYIAMVEQNSKA